jgi:sulfur-oxidizing protein SoxY
MLRVSTPRSDGSPMSRRHALKLAAAVAALPWWLPAFNAFAQAAPASLPAPPTLPALAPLDQRVRGVVVERGGLSLDIPSIAETGTSVPVVLFVNPGLLGARKVARLGILAPLNPRPVVFEIELGAMLAQARLTTSIRLGATQDVMAVAQLSDGTLWQHTMSVHLTGSACFDGT